MLRKIFRYLRKSRFRYQPIAEVLIFKENLLYNLKVFKEQNKNLAIAPVLKSNAYGHGLIQVAKILDKESVPFLVVDSYYEALILRNEGIRAKILIIGYTTKDNIVNSRLKDVAFTIISLDQLIDLAQNLNISRSFHLKIDTGMHRQGILLKEVEQSLTLLKSNKNIILEGLCSHFADADNSEPTFTLEQIKKWNEVAEKFEKKYSSIFYHLAATSGVEYSNRIKSNVARVGLGLYGIDQVKKMLLKPALELQTIISSIRTIGAGEGIGYGVSFKAKAPMRIATIPLGYFEGIDRRLSNIGFVKYKNIFCAILGLVSMNITIIDITLTPEAKIDDEVTIISSQKQDENSVENIAKLCGTIPYEILVHIPQQLHRKVV